MRKMIYCDIDGTLTDNSNIGCIPNLRRIASIRELSEKYTVILWSDGGTTYAEWFKKEHNLTNCIALGKPTVIIDDNPLIRPCWEEIKVKPEYLD